LGWAPHLRENERYLRKLAGSGGDCLYFGGLVDSKKGRISGEERQKGIIYSICNYRAHRLRLRNTKTIFCEPCWFSSQNKPFIHTFFRRDEMRSLIICILILLAGVLSGPVLAEWTTPALVEAGINTAGIEFTPYLSYDGLSLYFSRNTGTYSIYEAKRNQPSGDFTSVSKVFSTSGNACTPWVSSDNLRMYYHQEYGSWQIKVSTRASVNGSWTQGTLVSGLPSGICFPSLSSDELTIVYNNPNVGGWDMYMATRSSKDSAFGNIRSITELNTAGYEHRPFLSPDALSIYWTNLDQIYKATRSSLNGSFGNVQILSALDMPGQANSTPAISSDGTAIYFLSGASDIYVSYNVPEPVTLLLLGLGAAIMRKR
jgi:hypothetical protein